MWTILVFLGMVVLGGFLSYFGDLQGRRIGKKRKTVFGLRPKHTAILITSLTGSFIVALSVGGLLLVAQPVREVVLRGESAIRQIRDLEKLQKEIETRLAHAQLQADNADKQNVIVRGTLTQTQNNLTTAQKHLVNLQTDLQKGNVSLVKLEAQRVRLNQQNDTLKTQNQKLTSVNNELEKQSTKYGVRNDELGKENLELHREQITIQKQNDLFKANNIELAKKNSQLQKDGERLLAEQKDLEKQNSVLMQVSQDLNKANLEDEMRARKKIAKLETDIANLTRDRERLLAYLDGADSAVQQYVALRSKRICMQAGELIGRKTIDTSLPLSDLRREISGLFADAEATTTLRGATKGTNNRTIRILTDNLSDHPLSEGEIMEALLGEIKRAKGQQQLIATSLTNALAGEQVLVRLTMEPVRTTFRRGSIVASTVIPVVRSLDTMVSTLVQFLQKDVRNAAILAGTIPYSDKNTGDAEVGTLAPAELIELVDRLRRMGGEVVVSAVASDDLTSADPLKLTFRLTRPPTKS